MKKVKLEDICLCIICTLIAVGTVILIVLFVLLMKEVFTQPDAVVDPDQHTVRLQLDDDVCVKDYTIQNGEAVIHIGKKED